jgi:hypothetical protein
VWSYTSTPPYVFMAWCLVKHKDNCTFTCILYCTNESMMSAKQNHICNCNQAFGYQTTRNNSRSYHSSFVRNGSNFEVYIFIIIRNAYHRLTNAGLGHYHRSCPTSTTTPGTNPSWAGKTIFSCLQISNRTWSLRQAYCEANDEQTVPLLSEHCPHDD